MWCPPDVFAKSVHGEVAEQVAPWHRDRREASGGPVRPAALVVPAERVRWSTCPCSSGVIPSIFGRVVRASAKGEVLAPLTGIASDRKPAHPNSTSRTVASLGEKNEA